MRFILINGDESLTLIFKVACLVYYRPEFTYF